jgi:threonine aldolase
VERHARGQPRSEPGYGEDAWTNLAADAFRTLFESACEVFFVFNGTAANSRALASLCQSYHSVIRGSAAHVETDECGAPEFFSNVVLAEHARQRRDHGLPFEAV